MDADRQAGDRGYFLQKLRQRIPAICRMVLGGDTLNVVIGVRSVDPLVRVSPEPQLEIEAALYRFFADITQHSQIIISFGVGKVSRVNLVSGDSEQKRVGKEKICVGDLAHEIVAQTEA